MREEKVLLEATRCYLIRGEKVLLALKMKKIGAGFWNGYGGGIEPGENPQNTAIRELWEEAGIVTTTESLKKVAIVDFHNTKTDGTTFTCRVHVYVTRFWSGEPKATDEMATPTWFDLSKLPIDQMMPADRFWLPLALSGKRILAKASYGPFQKTLLEDVAIQEVA